MAKNMKQTRAKRLEAYYAGHAQGEIVRKTGNSNDVPGMGKKWENLDLESEWDAGYRDGMFGDFDPDRM